MTCLATDWIIFFQLQENEYVDFVNLLFHIKYKIKLWIKKLILTYNKIKWILSKHEIGITFHVQGVGRRNTTNLARKSIHERKKGLDIGFGQL